MHIPTHQTQVVCDTRTREDLEKFIVQLEPMVVPPCSGCVDHKKAGCSPDCSEVTRALSIEPDRYPIESKVAPLVYELMATRVMQTCWSCEGHMNQDNQLWKVPQVCFYSDAPIYPKLVLIHLRLLYQSKILSCPWQVVLSDFSQSLGLTYSIQPDLNLVEKPRLGSLQQDLKLIAETMHTKLKIIAGELLREYCK